MIIVFFILGACVVFFIIVLAVMMSLDALGSRTPDKPHPAKHSFTLSPHLKTSFMYLGILAIIVALIMLIIYLTHAINVRNIHQEFERKQQLKAWLQKHMPPPGEETIPVDTPIATTPADGTAIEFLATPDESALFEGQPIRQKPLFSIDLFEINALDERFEPSTMEFIPFDADKEPSTDTADQQARLENARPGDIFIIGYYDQLIDGKFTRSAKARYIQTTTRSTDYLSVTIPLPALRKNQTLTVPRLMSGQLIAGCTDDSSISLDRNGELRAHHPTQPQPFTYRIQRAPGKTPEFIFDRTITPWLHKEFATIPSTIKSMLSSVQHKSSLIKMATVCAILNTHFAYQTGLQQISLPAEQTWNFFLQDHISNGLRLIADCDVLCTYAYIYLKYLDLDAVFLIGYFNSPESPDTLRQDELHAMLYLKHDQQWIIFDSTAFTPTLSTPADESSADRSNASSYAASTAPPPRSISLARVIDQTDIPFFQPPQHMAFQLAKTTPGIINPTGLAAAITDLMLFDEMTHLTKKKNDHFRLKPAHGIQLGILLYLAALFITKMIGIVQHVHTPLLPLKRYLRPIYTLAMAALLSISLLTLLDNNPSSFAGYIVREKIALILFYSAGIISIIAPLVWLHHTRKAAANTYRLSETLRNPFIVAGILFGIAAVLMRPSLITGTACIIITLCLVLTSFIATRS